VNQTSPSERGLNNALATARTRWQALAERERRAISLVALLGGLFLFWSLAIQPAWQTLSKAPAELDRLDAQLQEMNRMAGESRELRGVTPVSATQTVASLQSATDRLGTQGRIVIQGDRVTLTLTNANPEALKDWLSEVRSAARVRPLEAQLSRSASGYSGTMLLGFGGTP
jgi:general secretion pathway protein M